MLTVRYDRLGLAGGDMLLDLGTGGGRHAFEAMRRGAVVVAVDADRAEVSGAAAMMAAMMGEDAATSDAATTDAGGVDKAAGAGGVDKAAGAGDVDKVVEMGGTGEAVVGDARRLPFADGSFDRVIAAEVLEHIPEDEVAMAELARVLRTGGTIAVTVPRWFPEKINWRLSSRYHDRPGGHVRIYRRSELVERLAAAGLEAYASHHAHALHSPYWWLRCAVGVDDDTHPAVRAYHRLLVWDITAASPVTRVPEAVLNPLLGKSAVVYAKKVR